MKQAFETTPTCEITGLPLPILPKGPEEIRVLSVAAGVKNPVMYSDEHHHVHPKKSPLLKTIGGKAMRHCRVQNANYFLHHNMYHNTFRGINIVSDEREAYEIVVPAVAGVIPREAIDFKGVYSDGLAEWEIVTMTDQEHIMVSLSTKVEHVKEVGKFLAHYATLQDIESVVGRESVIDEFLDMRTSSVRKREIARDMLRGGVSLSLEDAQIMDRYSEIREMGMIVKGKPRTFEWWIKKMIRTHSLDYFQDAVSDRLAAA